MYVLKCRLKVSTNGGPCVFINLAVLFEQNVDARQALWRPRSYFIEISRQAAIAFSAGPTGAWNWRIECGCAYNSELAPSGNRCRINRPYWETALSHRPSERSHIALAAGGMKKRSDKRKHCALAVVRRRQKFRPTTDPLPGGEGRPKFNQLEMVTTLTYKPSLVKIDASNFELSW